MRRNLIFTLLLALFSSMSGLAQGLNLQVGGTLTDGNGVPIGGTLVEYTAFSSTWQVIDSTSTAANGTYSFNVTTPPAVTNGFINVMVRCGNNFLVDTLFFSTGNTSFTSDFTCGPAQACDALFGNSPSLSDPFGRYFFYSGQTDTTTIVSYDWDFNDGTAFTTNSGQAQHTFASPGTYNVCLTITTTSGCANTQCIPVTIVAAPSCVADFFAVIQGPGQFSFTNQSSPITANTSFVWHFGDGSTSTQVNSTHTYTTGGTYQVALVMDDGSCIDSAFTTLTVLLACEAEFNATPDSLSNAVHFMPLSQGFNPGITFDWDFGDGNTAQGFSQNHTYANPGLYQVCLTVTDPIAGCSDTFCDSVVAGPQTACDASFTYAGGYFFYDGNTDTTQILSYHWYFGDGNLDTTTLSNVAHTYAANGIYPACLEIVTTSGCAAFTCDDVIIGTPPLTCDASFSIIPDSTSTNAFFFFPDSISNISAVTFAWDFGDNTTGSGPLPLHVYQNPGNYLVCLTVTNSTTGCTDTYCDSLVVAVPGSCQADFSYNQIGAGQVSFFNQSFPNTGNVSFVWDFGDGNTSTQANPVHAYDTSATDTTYLVSLILDDGNCADTIFKPVVVIPGCNAGFFAFVDSLGTSGVFVIAQGPAGSSFTTYSWDFGDGTTATGPSASHQYASAGSYVICLTVADSIFGCTATQCDTVTVGQGQPCQADFLAGPDATGGLMFLNLSSGLNLNYLWDFGDGNTSTDQSPVHTYASPGDYLVCLTVSDSTTGCLATSCDSVFYQPMPGLQLSGQVVAGNQPADNALVYLIQPDSLGLTLAAVDSTVTDSMGFFLFYGLDPGDYLVKAALQPNDPDYANYLPTYLGDELFWNLAVSVVLTQSPVFVQPINLVAGSNPGGPAFVGGLVSQGANKVEGEGLENVYVYLMDDQGNAVAHTLTDADGAYQFDNIAYGDYMLYVEMMGRYSYPWEVSLSAANPSFDVADFVANDTEVRPAGTTSVDDFAAEVRVFPNPARDFLTIETGSSPAADWDISLLNVVGQVMTGNRLETSGNRLRLDLQGLPNGIYLLRLQNGEQQLTRRFQKAR